jgi:hypothetical protein
MYKTFLWCLHHLSQARWPRGPIYGALRACRCCFAFATPGFKLLTTRLWSKNLSLIIVLGAANVSLSRPHNIEHEDLSLVILLGATNVSLLRPCLTIGLQEPVARSCSKSNYRFAVANRLFTLDWHLVTNVADDATTRKPAGTDLQ